MLTNKWMLKVLVIVMLSVAIVGRERRLVAERRRSAALALSVSNAEGERDSTRELRRSDSVRWFPTNPVAPVTNTRVVNLHDGLSGVPVRALSADRHTSSRPESA